MSKVLIIGGGGYVGTVMTSDFLRQGRKVVVLDRFVYANHFAVMAYMGDPNYQFVYGDMKHAADLEKVAEGVTDVVLLAGLVGDPITKTYPSESATINDDGVRNCIDFFADRDINKFIFASTCSNYGLIPEGEIAAEDYELNPLSLYATSKVEAEKYLLNLRDTASFAGVVLRFATAFGLSPRMRFDLTVSEFTRDLFEGKELVVFDEHTWRPYCHVRDFARLMSMVLDSDNADVRFDIFNAGGSVNNYTKKMIVDSVCKRLPKSNVSYNDKGSDPRNYRVSFEKVKRVLGFEPKYTVEDGIDELIEALKMGFYADSIANKNCYGNYAIDYK